MADNCPRCRQLTALNRKLAAMNQKLVAALRSTMTGASAALSCPQLQPARDAGVMADVTAALVTLGFSRADAKRLVEQHYAPQNTTSELLTKILQNPQKQPKNP